MGKLLHYKLFGRKGYEREDMVYRDEEPTVLKSEISTAIEKLKTGKAMGLDGIPVEAFKAGGITVVKSIKKIIEHIWTTGHWPP